MKKYVILILMTMSILAACDSNNTETSTTTDDSRVVDSTEPEENNYNPEDDVAPAADMCNDIPDQGEYSIVWCDEFNYRGLPDSTKWKYDVGGNGWGNNEVQYYTRNDRDNARVEDDNLVITAIKEDFGDNHYTSARLLSAGKAEFKYGRMDIRAKLPDVGGTWPALWMLGSNIYSAGWPACGEVDIMEHVANNLNVVHGSIHTTNYNHKENSQKTESLVLDDVTEYHVYSIEWTEKQIRFFIDDVNYFVFNNDEIMNPDQSTGNWPFDQKMFFILNIAMGGWGGTIDPNFEEAKMYVDYVRVYQKDEEAKNPTDITNLTIQSNTPTKSHLTWDYSNDDLGVRHYNVYLDGVLEGTALTPAHTLSNLEANTTYVVEVEAEDFDGNTSNKVSIDLTTSHYPTIPVKIEAEDYTEMFGIELEMTTDEGSGQNIGWIDPNDYLEYKIHVPESKSYTITYRTASQNGGGEIDLLINEVSKDTTAIPSTGGWQNWTTITSDSFTLDEGTHIIKLKANSGGFNLNWFEFNEVE